MIRHLESHVTKDRIFGLWVDDKATHTFQDIVPNGNPES